MITWVLLLFIGAPIPMKVEGYKTEQACEHAATEAEKKFQTATRKTSHLCFEGPVEYKSIP